MSPPARLWGACRTLALRSRPLRPMTQPARPFSVSRRYFADDTKPTDPNEGNFESLFKESDLESMVSAANNDGLRKLDPAADGGLTPAQENALYETGAIPPAASGNPVLDQLAELSTGMTIAQNDAPAPGHKFPLPTLPLPWHMQMKNRYHPVLAQISRLLMKDGKLSKAQDHLARVLTHLRTSPPPILSPKYPLLPGAPPASHLPLNPIVYLTLAIDSVAPLMRIRYIAGAAGGGHALEMPTPLAVRQRRRMAFKWILDVVDKKPSMGSGRDQFAHKLASEIIAVVEGRSAVWDKRQQLHKLATSARANLSARNKKSRGAKKL